MNVYYVNDTSYWPDRGLHHGGCIAINSSLRRRIVDAGHQIVAVANRPYGPIEENIEKADWLIVNGEGTFRDEAIGHEPGRLERLFDGMTLAKRMGRRVYLVNTVWCKMSDRWKDLLLQLDGISVREPASAAAIFATCGRIPEIHPDEAYFSPLVPGVDPNGYFNVVIGNLYHGNTLEHLDEYNQMFGDLHYCGLLNRTWSWTVKILMRSKLYITGQHHGIYAACRARCPFAAVRVNTHKLSSLFEWAGAKIPLADSSDSLRYTIDWAQTSEARSEFEKLWSFLEKQTQWQIPVS